MLDKLERQLLTECYDEPSMAIQALWKGKTRAPTVKTVVDLLGWREAHGLVFPEGHPRHKDAEETPLWRLRQDLEGKRKYDHEHWVVESYDPETESTNWYSPCPDGGINCLPRVIGSLLTQRLKYVASIESFWLKMMEHAKGVSLRREETDAWAAWEHDRKVLIDLRVAETKALRDALKESMDWHIRHELTIMVPLMQRCLESLDIERAAAEANSTGEHLRDIAMHTAKTEYRRTVTATISPDDEAVANYGVSVSDAFTLHYETHSLATPTNAKADAEADQNDTMHNAMEHIRWPVKVSKTKTVKVPMPKPRWLKFPEELELEFVEAGMSYEGAEKAALKEWGNMCTLMRVKARQEAEALGLIASA